MTVNFLITYPKEKFSQALRSRLANVSAPLYCPLRQLRAVSLTAAELQLISHADFLVITSPFALRIYLKELVTVNLTAGLVVLSQKMALKLKSAGFATIIVAPEENQISLGKLLISLSGSIVFLSGNLSRGADYFPKSVNVVQVYENTWSNTLEKQVVSQLMNRQIKRILVTSTSNYNRLKEIERLVPTSFEMPVYYTLGVQTAEAIRQDGRPVIVPANRVGVLERAVVRMCQDQLKIESYK